MYKYLGRLVGSTQGGQVLATTAPVNANTPFSSVAPATKFLAYGEDANSVSFNRALVALASNTDSLASVLDAPALRYEVLEPDPNPAGMSSYGNSNLVSVVSMSASVHLGTGARRPVSWVFVGLHKSRLGDFLQFERDSEDPAAAQLHTPTDVFPGSGTTSFFPAATYSSNSLHAPPDRVPGIRPITTNLPPYSGASLTTAIARWDADGCYLAATNPGTVGQYGWQDLYLQPGCFVFVEGGASQQNRGLYRIASLSGGTDAATAKAVLTNALTRITINEAAASAFEVGAQVSWRSRPDDDDALSGPGSRTHRAYVMYKDVPAGSAQAYLYLAGFSGGADLPVFGATSFKAEPGTNGTEAFNQFGLLELEQGAGQNANLEVGTLLFTGLSSTAVLSILPAGVTPPFLQGSHGMQTILPCSPPGFVLNPRILLGGNSAVVGGKFRVHAHVLTTVRDNLLSGGLSATRGSASQFGLTRFNPGYQAALERFVRWVHEGDAPSGNNHLLSREFGPTRQVLGHGLTRITLTASPVVAAGEVVSFGSPPSQFLTRAVVVEARGANLLLKNVTPLPATEVRSIREAPIDTSMWLIKGTDYFKVSAVSDPRLTYHNLDGSPGGTYYPSEGLDAAYHADYSSNPLIRGNRRGYGNKIYTINTRPFTLVLPSTTDDEVGLRVESERRDSGQRYTVLQAGSEGAGDLELAVRDGKTLYIGDGNTLASVAFSRATPGTGAVNPGTGLDPHFGAVGVDNLLGAVNQAAGLLVISSLRQRYAHLLGAVVTVAGPSAVNVTQGAFVGALGQLVYVPAINGLSASAAGVVAWNTLTDTYEFVTGLALSLVQEPVAYVSLPTIVDLRLTQAGVQHRTDLYVGGGPGQHFSTIGEAVRFLRWTNQLTDATYPTQRRWRILVHGPITETGMVTFAGLKGVLIEGFGEGTTISWGVGFDTLFDLAGADDLVLRNLHLKYDSAAAVPATSPTQRRVFYNATSTSRGVLLEGIRTEAEQGRLSCYGVLHSIRGLIIRDCRFEGATDVGFLFGDAGSGNECEDLVMTGVKVLPRTGTTPQSTPTSYSHFGVKLLSCRGVRMADCYVGSWTYCGVWTFGCVGDVVLHGLVVDGALRGGTGLPEPVGVFLQDESNVAYGHVLENCVVGGSAESGTEAVGIQCDVPGSLISGNRVRSIISTTSITGYAIAADKVRVIGNIYSVLPITGGTDEVGMSVTAKYCTILGNQTGGKSANLVYPSDNTFVANRDDEDE